MLDGELVLDDKVEDGAGGGEPPLQEQDHQGGVHHQELTTRGRARLLTHSPTNTVKVRKHEIFFTNFFPELPRYAEMYSLHNQYVV